MNPRELLYGLRGRLPSLLLIVLAGTGFWVFSHGMTVGSGSIVGYAEDQLHTVGPLQAGRLQAVPVRLGQAVKAGEVLAQLDTRPLELRRERLRAELAQAQAVVVAEQELQDTLLQLNQLQAVSTHIDEARARAELHELDLQVKRLAWLGSRRLVRESELEDARRRQRALAADLEARPAGTARELALMGRRPRSAAEQAQRLAERLAPYRAAVVASEAALREVEFELAALTLRSPVTGMVAGILQRAGDALGAGMAVVTVVTTRPGHIVAYVPERQLRTLQPGAPVLLRRPGSFLSVLSGRVTELAPMVEELLPRARASASVPAWGRRAIIVLDIPVPLVPGEAFRVSAR